MKKIIFVTPQFKNGGGNRVFVELANSISRNFNYKLEITFPNNSLDSNHYNVEDDVEIIKIGNLAKNLIHKLYNTFLLFRYLIKSLKTTTNLTILISDPILCVFLWVISKKHKNVIYRFIQADDYRIFDDLYVLKNNFFLFFFKFFTLLNYKLKINYVFNSSFTYDRFVEVSKRTDVAKFIVHPAVDNNIFYRIDNIDYSLNKKVTISLIAREHPLKKLDDFISVWLELPKEIKNNIENVYLISTDKLERFDLKNFTLIRPSTDIEIADILRKSEIFISTSLWEGFSLPPLEAMNCGAVILSSDSGGIKEYAINDFNSLLFEPGELNEFKNKLIQLIENVELRNILRKNSLNMIDKFSWDKSAKMLISFIEGTSLINKL
jgi:glycosyltransferase involved in cell wall biosynthesis